MGICIGSCIGRTLINKKEKVLQIVKLDGKILGLKAPVLVKDILVNFSAGSGIGLSKQALKHLPLDYQLKIGEVYHVLPSCASVSDNLQPSGVKRIKVVITKQQLQQLLTKQSSVAEVLSILEKTSDSSTESPIYWQPKLESIPEGSE